MTVVWISHTWAMQIVVIIWLFVKRRLHFFNIKFENICACIQESDTPALRRTLNSRHDFILSHLKRISLAGCVFLPCYATAGVRPNPHLDRPHCDYTTARSVPTVVRISQTGTGERGCIGCGPAMKGIWKFFTDRKSKWGLNFNALASRPACLSSHPRSKAPTTTQRAVLVFGSHFLLYFGFLVASAAAGMRFVGGEGADRLRSRSEFISSFFWSEVKEYKPSYLL